MDNENNKQQFDTRFFAWRSFAVSRVAVERIASYFWFLCFGISWAFNRLSPQYVPTWIVVVMGLSWLCQCCIVMSYNWYFAGQIKKYCAAKGLNVRESADLPCDND